MKLETLSDGLKSLVFDPRQIPNPEKARNSCAHGLLANISQEIGTNKTQGQIARAMGVPYGRSTDTKPFMKGVAYIGLRTNEGWIQTDLTACYSAIASGLIVIVNYMEGPSPDENHWARMLGGDPEVVIISDSQGLGSAKLMNALRFRANWHYKEQGKRVTQKYRNWALFCSYDLLPS